MVLLVEVLKQVRLVFADSLGLPEVSVGRVEVRILGGLVRGGLLYFEERDLGIP